MSKVKSGSQKYELLRKSREAALSAVQTFNNPQILFKSEIFVVISVISWTYLMHAYYKSKRIDIRYKTNEKNRTRYLKTKGGSYKHWELSTCIRHGECPLDSNVVKNLEFLIGLRNEIEHRMTKRIDNLISSRFQASCINYNTAAKALFGEEWGIEKHLSVSLQLASMGEEQVKQISGVVGLPKAIARYIQGFDGDLSPEEYNSPQYAYRVYYLAKTANHKGQADSVVEFIKPNDTLNQEIEKVLIKETERMKYLPTQIVYAMRGEGFSRFTMTSHTELWKALEAKESSKGYGVKIATQWYWYESWLTTVREHCTSNPNLYRF